MIEKKMIKIEPFGLDRCLHIYIPDQVWLNHEKSPVLYMFDGHNLYRDEDATYGHAWHIADTLAMHHIPLIVVGLECNHEGNERLNEFCPYTVKDSWLGDIEGRGKILLEWMTTTLKQWVDAHYPTNGINYIGGSSMGGLMALYGIIAHGDVYRGAACLSSAISFCFDELCADLRQASCLTGARIYMSYGSEEARSKTSLAAVVKKHGDLSKMLQDQGAHVYFDMIVKGKHSEETWANQVLDFVLYLGDRHD